MYFSLNIIKNMTGSYLKKKKKRERETYHPRRHSRKSFTTLVDIPEKV